MPFRWELILITPKLRFGLPQQVVICAKLLCHCAECFLDRDTFLNDGQAYRNLVKRSGWQGACFIGADRLEHAPAVEIDEEAMLHDANRWSALGDRINGSLPKALNSINAPCSLLILIKRSWGQRAQ